MLLIYETQVHAPNPGAGYSSVFTWKSWNRSIFFHDVVSHRICLVLCLLVSVSPYFSFDYLAIFRSLSLTPLPHTLLFSASLHPTPEFFSSHPASFFLFAQLSMVHQAQLKMNASLGTYHQWELLSVCTVKFPWEWIWLSQHCWLKLPAAILDQESKGRVRTHRQWRTWLGHSGISCFPLGWVEAKNDGDVELGWGDHSVK